MTPPIRVEQGEQRPGQRRAHRQCQHRVADASGGDFALPAFERAPGGVLMPPDLNGARRISRRIRAIPPNVPVESLGCGFVLGPILLLSDHDHEELEFAIVDQMRRDVVFHEITSAITPDEEETVFRREGSSQRAAARYATGRRHAGARNAGDWVRTRCALANVPPEHLPA